MGFPGAYTPFSTYTYESLELILQGQWVAGPVNLLGSTLAGILAAAAGVSLAKLL